MASSTASDKKKPSKPRAPKKPAASVVITEKLIAFLEGQKRLGSNSYPTKLGRLVELIGETTSSPDVKKAINSKNFKKRVLVPAKPKEPRARLLFEAPVCLAEDLVYFASSDSLLEFAFESACYTGKQRAFTRVELKSTALNGKALQGQFEQAFKERVAAGTTPSWLRWVAGKDGKELFFRQKDLGGSSLSEESVTPAVVPQAAVTTSHESTTRSTVNFEREFESAFNRLDRERGGNNFLKIRDLRAALPQFDRLAFDEGISKLRHENKYSLDSSDGNFVTLTFEEKEAGIMDNGSNLVYCSRR